MRPNWTANWQEERERWLLWLPVLVVAGAVAYFAASNEPVPWVAGGCTILAGAAAFPLRHRSEPAAVLLFAVAALAGGFQLANSRALDVAAPVLERPLRGTDIVGIIEKIERRETRARVLLTPIPDRNAPPVAGLERVRISLANRHAEDLTAGMTIRLPAVLEPPGRPTFPGGFDFRRWAWFQGIGATGYAVGTPVIDPGGTETSPAILLSRIRAAIGERVRATLPGETGDIAVALITGDRSGLSEDSLRAMRDSGLAHLLAISGLHLGLVAMTVFFVVRFLLTLVEPVALRYPVKKIVAAAALIGSFFYLLISGASVPTQRAFIMTGFVLVAVLMDRQAISMRLVALAAIIVVAMHPEATVGAGFQMSFAAVVALVAVYETAARNLFNSTADHGPGRRVLHYGGGVLLTTAIASTATMPFALHHFGRIATLGILPNLLAVPLMAFLVMPAALAALLFMPFGLEAPFLIAMGWGIDAILSIAETVAGWDAAHLSIPALSGPALSLIAIGGLWIAIWRRGWRFWGVPVIALGILLGVVQDDPDMLISEEGTLIMVHDGNGRAVYSTERGHRFLRETWQTALGRPEKAAWPGQAGRCDGVGCVFRIDDRRIAVTTDARSIAEDCRLADVVIATFPVSGRYCTGPDRIVDFFDLWRGGAHSLFIRGGEVTVEMVDPPGRARLWAPDPWQGR